MPRESRKRSESGVYHIMLRGLNRQQIFEDDEAYRRFLETLEKYREECGYSLYGYCLMPNHVHLVLREDKQPLETTKLRIGASYAYWCYNSPFKPFGAYPYRRAVLAIQGRGEHCSPVRWFSRKGKR